MQNMSSRKINVYKYVKLNQIKHDTLNNVFGVVKFAKLPTKSKGKDYHQVLSITDESLQDGEKIKITLFYSNLNCFPAVSIGDIIRFHRLKAKVFNNDLICRPGPGFSWLFVHDNISHPCCSSQNSFLNDSSKNCIAELQHWSHQHVSLLRDLCRTCMLEEVVPRQYLDLECQVVGTSVVEDGVCLALRVWDGTKIAYSTKTTRVPMSKVDPSVVELCGGLAVDVFLFDDHFFSSVTIKPAQFIKLCNLHASVDKSGMAEAVEPEKPMLELILHSGTAFSRGLLILNPDSAEVSNLSRRMLRCSERLSCDDSESQNTDNTHVSKSATPSSCPVSLQVSNAGPAVGGSIPADSLGQPVFSTCSEKPVGPGHGRKMDLDTEPVREKNGEFTAKLAPSASTTGSENLHGCVRHPTETCMLQTGFVITEHTHIERTSIAGLLRRPVLGKFRVQASLVDFHPNTPDPTDIVKQFCPKCNSIKPLPGPCNGRTTSNLPQYRRNPLMSYLSRSMTTLFGGNIADCQLKSSKKTVFPDLCPNCCVDGEMVGMEFVYMMRLVLSDDSGAVLVANLWRDQAVTFFRGVEPMTALSVQGQLEEFVSSLRGLCADPDHPDDPGGSVTKTDCCLFSHSPPSSSHSAQYHLFDTVLL